MADVRTRTIGAAGAGGPALRPATVADAAAGALTAGVVLGVVGALGLWAHQPWLFPSLGPTIVLQHASPHHGAGSLWNTLVGHAIGAAAGFAAVWITGAVHMTPEMATGVLTAPRVWATALAIALTILGGSLARADHPPAAATTMLISLGAFKPNWDSAAVLAVGIVATAVLGSLARGWHRGRRTVRPVSG